MIKSTQLQFLSPINNLFPSSSDLIVGGAVITLTALFFAYSYRLSERQTEQVSLQTRFSNAIRTNDTRSFQSIPIRDVDVNLPCPNDLGFFPLPPLHVAAYNGNPRMIEGLIQANADVNSYIEHVPGRPLTPLLSAIHGDQEEAVALLTNAGADFFLHNPLIKTAKANNPRLLTALLDLFMRRRRDFHENVSLQDFVDQTDMRGNTPLHYAIMNYRKDPELTRKCVQILAHFRADFNKRNNLGERPVHFIEATGDRQLLAMIPRS